jgi:hypothetical protein
MSVEAVRSIEPAPVETPLANDAADKAAGAAPAEERTTDKRSELPGIWSDHPATRGLPANLLEGDPFRDDPVDSER